VEEQVTEVRDAGPFERIMTLSIDESALEEAKARTARKLAGELKIKGFRPGKAPRRIVESIVGAEALQREAIDDALPGILAEAIRNSDIAPVVAPRVDDLREVDGGVEVDVRITLWPELDQVPDAEGRKITVERPAVTDEDVDRQVHRMRDQFAELEDVSREAFDGDFVLVDVTTSGGGGDAGAGSAEDLLYEIGSGSFLPGMDEPLRGAAAGHIAQFTTTLPASIGEEGGREVTARVLVKQVKAKRLPELTDEWVSDVSEFETVEEMHAALRKEMEQMRLESVRAQLEHATLETLREEMELELPEALVAAEMDATLHRFAHRLETRGVSIDQYLGLTGQSEEAFVSDLRDQAEVNLRTRILLEGVARHHGLEVEEAEVDEAIRSLAKAAGMEPADYRAALERGGQGETLAGDILRRKAIDRLLEVVVPVDASGTELEVPGLRAAGEDPVEADAVADDDPDESEPTGPVEVDE
jgi:trigger factor